MLGRHIDRVVKDNSRNSVSIKHVDSDILSISGDASIRPVLINTLERGRPKYVETSMFVHSTCPADITVIMMQTAVIDKDPTRASVLA